MTTRPRPHASGRRFPRGGVAAVALVLIFSACATAHAHPAEVNRPIRFYPPAVYRVWWDEVERCSGKEASFGVVRWWMVTQDAMYDDGEPIVGLLHRPTNHIYLPASYLYYKGIVQHEIQHVVDPRPGHPTPPFGTCVPLYAAFR